MRRGVNFESRNTGDSMGRPRADGLSTLTIPVTEKFRVQIEREAGSSGPRVAAFVRKAIEEKIDRIKTERNQGMPEWVHEELGVYE
jgi:hypothetical protein